MNKKIYVCGGFVRDMLINKYHHTNIIPHDKDYVAVGYTIEDMLSLGYKQVGKNFPVFLDNNGNEIALARTEIKTGNKHTDFKFDFNPNITLKEDCLRRNHTINALYLDESTGEIIDYVGGIEDIKNKIIKHVSDFYMQDPLRVLITARQSAQLNFNVDQTTIKFMKEMVDSNMLEHLTPERVWMEMEKALSKGNDSSKFFRVLKSIDALKTIFPEIYNITQSPEQIKYHPSGNTFEHTMIALDRVKECSSIIKFAVLCHDFGKGNTPKEILPKHIDHDKRGIELIKSFCDNFKIPNNYKNFAMVFCENHMRISKFLNMKTRKKYDLIKQLSNNFKNMNLLYDYITCFIADWTGENVQTDYNNIDDMNNIIFEIKRVFNIMNNKTLEDLPFSIQQNLHNYKNEKFGKLYRDAMINYLNDMLRK